jgi:hypothetical protein
MKCCCAVLYNTTRYNNDWSYLWSHGVVQHDTTRFHCSHIYVYGPFTTVDFCEHVQSQPFFNLRVSKLQFLKHKSLASLKINKTYIIILAFSNFCPKLSNFCPKLSNFCPKLSNFFKPAKLSPMLAASGVDPSHLRFPIDYPFFNFPNLVSHFKTVLRNMWLDHTLMHAGWPSQPENDMAR